MQTLRCTQCGMNEPLSMFRPRAHCKGGYSKTCSDCYDVKSKSAEYKKNNKATTNAATRKRQAAKISRTPKWLSEFDHLKMKCLYQVAAMRTRESGYAWHVDHIVPLQGRKVSGMHVPWNLQVIPADKNVSKGNRFDV